MEAVSTAAQPGLRQIQFYPIEVHLTPLCSVPHHFFSISSLRSWFQSYGNSVPLWQCFYFVSFFGWSQLTHSSSPPLSLSSSLCNPYLPLPISSLLSTLSVFQPHSFQETNTIVSKSTCRSDDLEQNRPLTIKPAYGLECLSAGSWMGVYIKLSPICEDAFWPPVKK